MNALQILDEAINNNGCILFSGHPYTNRRAEHATEESYVRDCVKTRLDVLTQFISFRFTRTKVGYKEANVYLSGTLISFSLAPILLLPEPHVESLLVFKGLLELIQSFLTTRLEQGFNSRIQITNNRDRHKKTYGEIKALTSVKDLVSSITHVEFTEELRAYISGSPVLTAWLRLVALDLNKLGPHSWLIINQRMFEKEG